MNDEPALATIEAPSKRYLVIGTFGDSTAHEWYDTLDDLVIARPYMLAWMQIIDTQATTQRIEEIKVAV